MRLYFFVIISNCDWKVGMMRDFFFFLISLISSSNKLPIFIQPCPKMEMGWKVTKKKGGLMAYAIIITTPLPSFSSQLKSIYDCPLSQNWVSSCFFFLFSVLSSGRHYIITMLQFVHCMLVYGGNEGVK